MLSFKQTLLIFFLLSWLILSSTAGAAEPVVKAILFWSDGCPHCHYVIEETLPPLLEKYGPRFQLKLLQVEHPENQRFYRTVVQTYQIPPERLGVPALIIGKRVLVGSQEIPEQLPAEIERGLATGGLDFPALAGLAGLPAIDLCGPELCEEPAEDAATVSTPADLPESGTVLPALSTPTPDPMANGLAITVLGGMLGVLGYAFVVTSRRPAGGRVSTRRGRPYSQPLPRWLRRLIPLLALFGLGVALYLTYAKLTRTGVVCGPVGDCEAVQNSVYSELLGIPVALLGALSYLGLLGLWAIACGRSDRLGYWARLGFFGLAFIGTLFSLYLTMLEPFVIGAVCAWCLASAVTMTLILLLGVYVINRGGLS